MFATKLFKSDGWIFHGYVYVLGKPSIELQEFAGGWQPAPDARRRSRAGTRPRSRPPNGRGRARS